MRLSAMLRSFCILLAIFTSSVATFLKAELPIPSRQIIAVISEGWDIPHGKLLRLEADVSGSNWKLLPPVVPVSLGRSGLAVGLGLHSPDLSGPQNKREGDERSPAGIFRLEGGFGKLPLAPQHFPYRQCQAGDFWVDDPASAFYNEWVDESIPATRRDWRTAETLLLRSSLYDYAVIVGHNRRPARKGAGSAIFLHVWAGPGHGTAGCTAMAKADMRELLLWLDRDRFPVLVQSPRSWLRRLALPQVLESQILAGTAN